MYNKQYKFLAKVSAFAPGKEARTEIDGGEISGNWLTGNRNSATIPHKQINNEIVAARIGRWTKKLCRIRQLKIK